MKIIIIGGVAAGTSAAAKARRNNETAEIKIFDQDEDMSYSVCGLPYYIGTEVKKREELVPRDAAFFKKKYNVDVYMGHQAVAIDIVRKVITVKNLRSQEKFEEAYERLILATGASVRIPSIPGIEKENVFSLRNVRSADRIRAYVLEQQPQRAVVIGSGFIGLEVAENLKARGLEVTVVEMASQVMPALDADMAMYVEAELRKQGVSVITDDSAVCFEGKDRVEQVLLKSGKKVAADMVIVAAGVQPKVSLAQQAGIALGVTGAIKVNTKMQTSVPNVYACGDCAEGFSLLTQAPLYRPMGSTANKMGRIAGDQATGGTLEFRGVLGTGIVKVFDLTVAHTGMSEQQARKEGYAVVVCHNIKPDKPEYFHGQEMVIKGIADEKTGRLLGAQIVGKNGVDKRMDVFVTAMSFGAHVEDLFHLDLAYAPPFSTTKDPVLYTGMILDNAISRGRKLITSEELMRKQQCGAEVIVIDARAVGQYEKDHMQEALNIPQEKLREAAEALDKTKMIVTYCNKGVTGNAAQNILLNRGFAQVYNLSGGHKQYQRIQQHLSQREEQKK